MPEPLKPKAMTQDQEQEQDEFSRMAPEQLMVSLTRSMAEIAACSNGLLFIVEKWAVKNQVVTLQEIQNPEPL